MSKIYQINSAQFGRVFFISNELTSMGFNLVHIRNSLYGDFLISKAPKPTGKLSYYGFNLMVCPTVKDLIEFLNNCKISLLLIELGFSFNYSSSSLEGLFSFIESAPSESLPVIFIYSGNDNLNFPKFTGGYSNVQNLCNKF